MIESNNWLRGEIALAWTRIFASFVRVTEETFIFISGDRKFSGKKTIQVHIFFRALLKGPKTLLNFNDSVAITHTDTIYLIIYIYFSFHFCSTLTDSLFFLFYLRIESFDFASINRPFFYLLFRRLRVAEVTRKNSFNKIGFTQRPHSPLVLVNSIMP